MILSSQTEIKNEFLPRQVTFVPRQLKANVYKSHPYNTTLGACVL